MLSLKIDYGNNKTLVCFVKKKQLWLNRHMCVSPQNLFLRDMVNSLHEVNDYDPRSAAEALWWGSPRPAAMFLACCFGVVKGFTALKDEMTNAC